MNTQDRMKIFFYDRAPNTILEDHVLLEFADVDLAEVTKELGSLVDDAFLELKDLPANARCPSVKRRVYRITPEALGNYPIVTEIEAAGIKVPRLLDGDSARAEDVNALVHAVNRIIDAKVAQLQEQMDAQHRKYWAGLVTIFALFISLFSVINVGVKPALFSAELLLSPEAMMFQSLINILPLTVVLLIFVFLLSRVLRAQ